MEEFEKPKSYENSLSILKYMDMKRRTLKSRPCSQKLTTQVCCNHNPLARAALQPVTCHRPHRAPWQRTAVTSRSNELGRRYC